MNIKLIFKKQLVAIATLLLCFCWANGVSAQEDKTWQFEATLYGWYTDIGGTVVDSGSVIPGGPFEIDAASIIDSLEMVFMGAFEVRKNRWSIITDAVYLDVGGDKNTTVTGGSGVPVNASVDMNISTLIVSGAVGYDVVQSDRGTLAVIGGVRYADIETEVKLGLLRQQSERSNSEGFLDGIVGVRGSIKLNENWFLPYYADIGAGDSDLTYQALGGIGYRFGWGDIKLVYRYLKYEMADDKPLQDLDVSGPALGIGFRF